MWICPICGNSGSVKRFCGYCGFDLTSDAVAAPTFCELPPSCSAARANARRRFALNSSYSVQKNRIVDGRIRTGTQTHQERFDPQIGAYAVPGSRVVDNQVRTDEASAGQSPLHHNPSGPSPDPAGSPYGSQVERTARTSQTAPGSGGPQAASGFNPRAGAHATPGTRQQIPLHQKPYDPGPAVQPGQAGRPKQQASSSGKGRGVFRTVLGVIMAMIALMAFIVLVSGEAGSDSAYVIFAVIFYASIAWLLLKKRKQK